MQEADRSPEQRDARRSERLQEQLTTTAAAEEELFAARTTQREEEEKDTGIKSAGRENKGAKRETR